MFRLIEPSSSQNHNTGTFSECVHYGIPYCLQNYIDLQDQVLFCWSVYLNCIYSVIKKDGLKFVSLHYKKLELVTNMM
jgi:hypothetical protein